MDPAQMSAMIRGALTAIALSALLYLPSLLLSWWWWRRHPLRSIQGTFWSWWTGALLIFLPKLIFHWLQPETSNDASVPPFVSGAATLLQWAGGMLLLRAAMTLIFWDHRRPRARGLLRGLAIAALVSAFAVGPIGLIFVLPWIVSCRWRTRLNTGQLALASLTFLVALFLLASGQGSLPHPPAPSGLTGLRTLSALSAGLGWLYALVGLPASLLQLPFSYRRIRGRLALSHLLAGLVPAILAVVVLGVAAGITIYRQRAHAITDLIARDARSLEGRIRDRAQTLEPGASRPAELSARPAVGMAAELGALRPADLGAGTETIIVRDVDGQVHTSGRALGFSGDSLLAQEVSTAAARLFCDGRALYLRARVDTVVSTGAMRVEGLRLVDSSFVASLARVAGFPVEIVVAQMNGEAGLATGEGVYLRLTTRAIPGIPLQTISGGPWRLGGAHGWTEEIPCLVRTPSEWRVAGIHAHFPMPVVDRVAGFIPGDQQRETGRLLTKVLLALLLFYCLVVAALAHMVWRMGRATTLPAATLRRATEALSAGRLDHRIEVAGDDELWTVARSFNAMTEDLVRMREVERHAQRLEEELRLAHEIQARLFPAAPPAVPGYELGGLSIPAREVGGDYFDYLTLPGGQVGLVVADVSGKGIPAALLMSAFRAALRTQDLSGLGPARVLSRLNGYIYASVDPGKFITVFLGLLDPATGELRYANAGHDAPILIHCDGARADLLPGGLILGVLPETAYEEGVVQMPDGTLLFAFTDGVTEAQNAEGEFFGEEPLVRVLQRLRVAQGADLLQGVITEVRSFSGTAPQSDDITILMARRN
jgi:serine phosphatase RsbU (regulator of sigma subunit)